MSNIKVIDLFCGAGGTTTGIEQAEIFNERIAEVVACVNHDAMAIKSHATNHPTCEHYTEDIRTLNVKKLPRKKDDPESIWVLWASLECTNFSKAKGGKPREADSRTLADQLYRYINHIKPDYIMIENVREFLAWGPLDENGKPLNRLNGKDFMKWRYNIEDMGYTYDHRFLNAADFGAYTSRIRYFAIFAKKGLPIAFPEPTHDKLSRSGLSKWKAVKEVLDLEDEGRSIFTRTKELSEKTLERVHAGLVKFVALGDTEFISKYFSGRPEGKNITVNGPAGTIKTVDSQALVQANFMVHSHGGDPKAKVWSTDRPARTICAYPNQSICFIQQRHNGDPKSKVTSVEQPARTVTATGGNQEIVNASFLAAYYSEGGQLSSSENPCPTISTKDRFALVQPFIMRDFTTGDNNQSINNPAGSIMSNPKLNLVQPFLIDQSFGNSSRDINSPAPTVLACRKNHYLVNPQWNTNQGGSMENPAFTLIARMDKTPPYLVTTEAGELAIEIYETDSPMMQKIKMFMAAYGIVDIKMRMLKVPELLKIQGFPTGYILHGTQTDMKKFIGNSVVPVVPKKWFEALATRLNTFFNHKAA